MKKLLCLAAALSLAAACTVEETHAEETKPSAEVSGGETANAVVHYVCAGGEHEKDAPLSEGVPECCGSPMTPAP
jgi:uncharacterized lipoprotein YajG